MHLISDRVHFVTTPTGATCAVIPLDHPAFPLIAPIDHSREHEPYFVGLLAELGAPAGYMSAIPSITSMTVAIR